MAYARNARKSHAAQCAEWCESTIRATILGFVLDGYSDRQIAWRVRLAQAFVAMIRADLRREGAA